MCEAAVRLIKAAGYTNAGTVEFIVDQRRQLLLHRGQRPHPGRASGDRDGHRHRPDQAADPHRRRRAAAVHAGRHRAPRRRDRVPHQRRRPRPQLSALAPARSSSCIVPGGPGVRFDSHAHAGYTVPPYYDSMIGKLIVHQPTRERSDRTACSAPSRELRIEGIKTTIPLHQEILSHARLRRRPHRHDVRRANIRRTERSSGYAVKRSQRRRRIMAWPGIRSRCTGSIADDLP